MNLDFFRGHYPSAFEGISEALLGLVFYLSLFHGCIYLLTLLNARFTNARFSRYEVVEISNKFVSSTFAVNTCTIAIKVYLECSDDLIHGRCNVIRHYMCFAVLYFIYDTYAMFVVHMEIKAIKNQAKAENKAPTGNGTGVDPDSGEYLMRNSQVVAEEPFIGACVGFLKARPLMVAHHLVLPLILFPIFMGYETGLGDCLLAIGFLMEASTPFVSARKVLSIMGMKKSLLYCFNGALMTILFFVCRVLIFPIIYWLFARQLGVSFIAAVRYHVPWFCTVATIVIWLPQVYWWKIMLKGCIKVLSGMNPKKDS